MGLFDKYTQITRMLFRGSEWSRDFGDSLGYPVLRLVEYFGIEPADPCPDSLLSGRLPPTLPRQLYELINPFAERAHVALSHAFGIICNSKRVS
jgi:hypothetical protein